MGLMDKYIKELNELSFENMYNDDFLLTWEKSEDELKTVLQLLKL